MVKSLAYFNALFITGYVPTQQDYVDFADTLTNLSTILGASGNANEIGITSPDGKTKIQLLNGELIASYINGSTTSQALLYNDAAVMQWLDGVDNGVFTIEKTDITISHSQNIIIDAPIIQIAGSDYNPIITIKISLTNDQINSGFSSPTACGITVPTGKYLQIISANGNYNQGDGLQSLTSFSLTITTKPDYQAIMRATTLTMQTKWAQFVIDQSGDSFAEGQDLIISTDVDSGAGTGTIDIYITYMLIDK